jgi:hypothetical protein
MSGTGKGLFALMRFAKSTEILIQMRCGIYIYGVATGLYWRKMPSYNVRPRVDAVILLGLLVQIQTSVATYISQSTVTQYTVLEADASI